MNRFRNSIRGISRSVSGWWRVMALPALTGPSSPAGRRSDYFWLPTDAAERISAKEQADLDRWIPHLCWFYEVLFAVFLIAALGKAADLVMAIMGTK